MTSVQIDRLTAETHESGFGLGHSSPRLSWTFKGTQRDWKQQAYHVIVTSTEHTAEYNIDSDRNVLVPWPGPALKSRERATVAVRAQGADESWTQWQKLDIEAALLLRSDWTAVPVSRSPFKSKGAKDPFCLRKNFDIPHLPERARAYVTAHGIYELEVNGKRVSDQVLSPGWTSYDHQLTYQTYDITPLLFTGSNTIGAHIGEGWYAGRLGRPGTYENYGDRPSLFAQVEYDGQIAFTTDDTWEWLESPIVASGIYDGEVYDSRLAADDWALSGRAKGQAQIVSSITAELVASDSPPVRRLMEIDAKEIITTPSGKTVVDFGQNLVGWVRVNTELQGVSGNQVVLKFAEVLEHGELGMRPLRDAKCTDTIVLGGSTAGWEPKFTFHGFRYMEVSGVPDLDLKTFTAVVIFSDLAETGTFESSHAMINQLHSNIIWGMRGNFISIPTDCPQRDERLGWTGDIQVFAPTANYLYDASAFLSSWLKDVRADQKKFNGIVPTVVPFVHMHGNKPVPHAIWADVIILLPWDLYTSFGDVKVLEDNFSSMISWLEDGLPRGPNRLWDKLAPNYADWLDPRAPPQYPAHGITDTHLVANAYLTHVTGVVSRVASILGHDDLATKYSAEHDRFISLFREEYITSTGRLASDSQTAYTLALRFGLFEDRLIPRAVERLSYLIRWNYFKISTGFAGTPIILSVLADNNLLGLAYRMLQEKDCPSWLYTVSMGATTMWERWDSMLPDGTINPGKMTSFNHYALGSVAAFLHNVVGGLSSLEPGWKSALIKPQPGGTVSSATTSYASRYGLFKVQWSLSGEDLTVNIVVPPNATATVVLPGIEQCVGSGERSYKAKWPKDGDWPPAGIPGAEAYGLPDVFAP